MLLSLIGQKYFEFVLSVPLALEYEELAFRQAEELRIPRRSIEAILNRICFYADLREIFFLWRPHLPDPNDDMVLEVAIEAGCDTIVTYNIKDFVGVEQFGISCLTPQAFLQQIGVIT